MSLSEMYQRKADFTRRLAWVWIVLAAIEGLNAIVEFVVNGWNYGVLCWCLALAYFYCWWIQRELARVRQETATLLATIERIARS